jgi:RHS repeat-associated protein
MTKKTYEKLESTGGVVITPTNQTVYDYKYNGQEWQDELGLNWYTYRYRNYDPSFGRFMGIDPVSEEYFSISTFQFAHNNPVWKIEIEGLEGEPSNGKPDIKNHEPVKVKNNTTNAYVGGGLVEVKVVQESTKEVAKKTVLGNFLRGVGSTAFAVAGALLTDTMSPNYGGRTSEIQPEHDREAFAIDQRNAINDYKIEEKSIEETGIKRIDSKSSADAEKLKLDLAFSEKASLFNKDGTLKQEVINNSKSIIPGNDLKNPSLVNELTKNGSNLDDWSKMSYSTGSGKNRIEVHYYYNNTTGETNYSLDYKTKLIGQ